MVTCAVAEAFLHAYHITNNSNHLDVCKSVADFLLKDLNHIEVGSNMQCLSYDLHSSWKVINVNSFVSAFLAKLYNITKKTEYKIVSQAIMRWMAKLYAAAGMEKRVPSIFSLLWYIRKE